METKLIEEKRFTELSAEPKSSDVQYKSFPVEIPGNDQRIVVSLGYRRCHDFDKGNQPGQDVAAVRGGGGFVVGIVADGVSQSFYGHLAAQYVSERLLQLLWEQRKSFSDKDQVEKALKLLQTEKMTAVQNFMLPEDLPNLLRAALESTRKKGSQTVFSAFVLDGVKKRLRLYQVGDVTVVVRFDKKEPEIIEAQPKGRWSSAGRSELHLLVSDREKVNGIIIKSDGAGPELNKLLESAVVPEDLSPVMEKFAGKDDVSFIAVRWDSDAPKRKGSGALPELGQPSESIQKATRFSLPIPLLRVRDVVSFSVGIIVGIIVMLGYLRMREPPNSQDQIARRLPSESQPSIAPNLPGTEKQPTTSVPGNSPSQETAPSVLAEANKKKPENGQPKPYEPQEIRQKEDESTKVLLTIDVHEVTQQAFFDSYGRSQLKTQLGNERTEPGELIAHVDIEVNDVSRAEFKMLPSLKSTLVKLNSNAGHDFFVRITGFPQQKKASVEMQIFNTSDAMVQKQTLELRGRQEKTMQDLGDHDRFLGYYNIRISEK